MPRQDVPYGGAICRLKERIAEIWDELGKKLHSINGVEGDAAGDVKIVSGDAAVIVTSDQVQHEIEIALDTSQLPAAAVSSVNGQTGAVVLDANDIDAGLTPPGTSVAQDLASTKQQMQVIGGLMQQEVIDRQNADSTLQTNINASNGRISVLETEDANNMKLNRSQTAIGDNTFTGRLKAQGQPAYYPLQPTDDVATIGTLDAYTPMVRTTGSQEIGGIKTFYGINIKRNTPGLDFIDTDDASNVTTPATLLQTLLPFRANDNSINFLMQFIHNSDGSKWVQMTCFAENGAAHAYRICGVDANGNQMNPQWLN